MFARVLKGDALGSIHLESPNSGDVFVQAAPGYCLSDELGSKKAFAPSSRYAETGFDTALPEMRGFFVACGNGVSSGRVIPAVAVTDIAPTIAKALHMEPSVTMVGRVLDGIWP